MKPSTNYNLVEKNKLISTRRTNVLNLLLNGNIQDKLIRGRLDPHVDVMLTRQRREVSMEAERWWKVRQEIINVCM